MNHYIDMKTYNRLVEALTKVTPCPITGTADDAIKIALGEEGGIWPMSIKPDTAHSPKTIAPTEPQLSKSRSHVEFVEWESDESIRE